MALLPFQQAFVDKLLSLSLGYGHILYCISNETNESAQWGAYWARYIRKAAARAGVEVHVTEMWEPVDVTHPMHRRTIDNPDLYTFVDISQNNVQRGQLHWDRIQQVRNLLENRPRPINNTKIYTFDLDPDVAVERWWRIVLGGCASARFHRPHPLEADGDQEKLSHVGLGLSPLAQVHIRSARLLANELAWPDLEPDDTLVTAVFDHEYAVRTEKTHVAYTRAPDGKARLYVNGEEAAALTIGGSLSSWDDGLRLALGDEITGGRAWRGVYHGVAMYNRALDASEIAHHCAAG
ncbi:MAG TPA: LamG domain-containing protein, partial [Candidatus Hydrogenedentes bacterium]|nr:LamG domain-containing protein [Candidatus Hydrogenedentota bacterium]